MNSLNKLFLEENAREKLELRLSYEKLLLLTKHFSLELHPKKQNVSSNY